MKSCSVWNNVPKGGRKWCCFIPSSEFCCSAFITVQEGCSCAAALCSDGISEHQSRSWFRIQILLFKETRFLNFFFNRSLELSKETVKLGKGGWKITKDFVPALWCLYTRSFRRYAQLHRQQDFKQVKECYFRYPEWNTEVKVCVEHYGFMYVILAHVKSQINGSEFLSEDSL